MAVPTHNADCETTLWPTTCSNCRKRVYFMSCTCGSAVYFDTLGPFWDVHDCTLRERTKKTKKIRVRLESGDHRTIDLAARKIVEMAKYTDCEVSGPVPLPTEIVRFEKRAEKNFAVKKHKRLIILLNPNAKTMVRLEELNLPSSVDVEIK